MAARYWVGGTASWDATAGTKWALTSGGAGGQAVPTAADDVFFDAASGAVTCTISAGNTGAKSINCTGFTGTITHTTGVGITVAGSVTLVAGMTFNSSTGVFTFTGTGTLTTAGKTFSSVTVNGVGITVTLGDALTTGALSTVNITNGTFTTNNFAVTSAQLNIFSGTNTINLGSSVVTLSNNSNPVNTTITNTTFNAGTSQINVTGNAPTFAGGGLTFYNVSFTNTSVSTRAITGANIFNNLAITASAAVGVIQVTFDSRQTINGTLSTTGTAGNRRVWFRGVTYGIAQTLTINSAPSLTDADFRDIYVVGTAAPISGTRIGDLRGCRGITFDAPKTVYWNLAGAQSWSANGWSDTSTGTPSTDFFPLAQDTATFTNAGSVTGTISLDSAIPYTGSVDMSGRTSAMVLSLLNPFTIYGSWASGSGTGLTTASTLTFSGRNNQTITSAGKTFSGGITIDSYGGTVQLADALNIGSNSLTVTNGTFDTKNYNVTAGILASSNSNVRAINLGSSTVTLSNSGSIVGATTTTNLAFTAGTSTIIGISNGGISTAGLTFYNVNLTSTTANSEITVTGANTYNNLSITAPSTAGLRIITFFANQTITGTLTVAGASPVRRIFLRSDTLGTTRTLTVNSLSAQDCDFRDITIAGAAAGSSPTRAGDCGGNTGITFPAAKTVYWNLAGAQNWSATAWATTSGGTPAVNNFPLAQDTAVFDNTGSVTGTITINATWNIGTFDASARTSAMTLGWNAGGEVPFYKDYILGSGITHSYTTGTPVFSGRGIQTIITNGAAGFIAGSMIVNSPNTTVQLGGAFTTNGLGFSVSAGNFDAAIYNFTVGVFSCTNSISVIKMGSGTWTMTSAGTVWNFNAGILYKQTANIVLASTNTNARTFSGNGFSYNKLTIGGATGTSTLTITGNNQFTELASTKTVAHTIDLGTTTQTFGAWTVTGTAGNVVTLTGTGTNHVLAGACTSGIDYLAMGSIGFAATSPGEFYAGANSTGTAAAPVYRTAKPADSTRYWVGGTGNWSDTARWSTGSGGAGGASVPRSHDDVVFDSASNATAYTATVNAVTGGIRTKALTIAGPASGNVTLAGSTAINGIHGDVTLPATGLTRTYTGDITLSSSATGRTLTTNGVGLSSAIAVDGIGCGWSLGSALTMGGAKSITITNGSIDFATYNLTTESISSSNNNSRAIVFGSGTITIPGGISFGATETSRANLTVTAGTAQINFSSASTTFSGNNQAFYNVAFINTSTGIVTINGANTFNNLSFTGAASAGLKNISVTANQTITDTLSFLAGTNATMRQFVQSNTIGTTRTLTCANFVGTDVDFRDITIAGAAAPVSGTRLGDCKGNSGITFDAAKTVYFTSIAGGNWGNNSWTFVAGNAADPTAFPLAQDTAIFPISPLVRPGSGLTVAINAAYNIGTIDMSARTSNTMTLATGTTTPAIYGNWINGTGTTLSGTGTLTFAGRGSQTITSAGRTFTQSIEVRCPSGSVALLDAFTSNRNQSTAFAVYSGSFLDGGYNLTLTDGGIFTSTDTDIRSLSIDGTWSLGHNGNPFNALTTTRLTVTGTGTISCTGTIAKEFRGGSVDYSGITLNQGGAGTLTITGNNTFANISNTYKATGATTIAMGTTTQRVGNFTASGEAGRVLTVQGTSAGSPATLIFTGAGQATTPTTDYLAITGVRAYSLDTTWYAGNNSTNNGSLGWYFEAGGGGPISVFIIESSTAADAQSSLATLEISVSETTTAADAQAAGLIYIGTLNESATAADVAEAFRAFLADVSESATSSDLLAASLTLSSTISELTTGSDATAVESRISFPTVAEAAQMADVLSGGLLFLSNISEATTAQEIAASILIFNRAVAEATTVSEVLAAVAVFQAAVPEQVSGADVANALITAGGAINEALTALDDAVAANTTSPTISEAVTASESTTNVYTANPVIAETAIPLDATQVVASTFNAASAETAIPLDTPQGANTGSSSLSESAAVSDAGSAAAAFYCWAGALPQPTANIALGTSGQGSLIFNSASFGDNTAVVANGTGVGDTGGFVSGGNYIELKYDGSGSTNATLTTIDLSFVNVAKIKITAIAGSGSNGGSDPVVGLQVSLLNLIGSIIYNELVFLEGTYITKSVSVPAIYRNSVRKMRITSTTTADQKPNFGIKEIAFYGVGDSLSAEEYFVGKGVLSSSVSDAASLADTTSVAPSTFGVIALAAAQAAESFNPAGSVYNAALPIQGARAADSILGAYLWNPIDDNQTPNWQNVTNSQGSGWVQINTDDAPNWQPTIDP